MCICEGTYACLPYRMYITQALGWSGSYRIDSNLLQAYELTDTGLYAIQMLDVLNRTKHISCTLVLLHYILPSRFSNSPLSPEEFLNIRNRIAESENLQLPVSQQVI